MLKGVIFDMDGTLTLTESLHNKAFAAIFKKYGVDFSLEEQVMKYSGSGSKNIFTAVFAERGVKVSEKDIEDCIAAKRDLYTKIVQESEIPLVPGVKEFLQRLENAGFKKIIATGNSNLDVVYFILKKVGLDEFFPDIVSIAEVAHGKPFPDVFEEAARRINCTSHECIVFEDAPNGVEGAKAAGMRCIALETTSKKEDLIAAGAAAVVKDYFHVTDALLYA